MNRMARWSVGVLGTLVLAVVLVPMMMTGDPLAIGDVLASRFVAPLSLIHI